MGLNITHTMNNLQFENKESLKNSARDILSRQGVAKNSMQNILNQTLFGAEKVATDVFVNPQLAILKASNQISANNSLKETLKYLKSQANKKQTKTPVLGELWGLLNENPEAIYNGELVDFQIDESAQNIFEAA